MQATKALAIMRDMTVPKTEAQTRQIIAHIENHPPLAEALQSQLASGARGDDVNVEVGRRHPVHVGPRSTSERGPHVEHRYQRRC